MNTTPDGASDDDRTAPTKSSQIALRLELSQLLQGRQEAVIVHNDQEYRLRLTSNGKLILTK